MLSLQRPAEIIQLSTELEARVLGQTEALKPIVDACCRWKAGLAGQDKPVAAFLMLGPTGVGKTLTVEVLAEVLHGDGHHLIKIHCAEYRHSHEVARLVGAPPGYIDHKETQPRLSQRRIQEAQSKSCQLVLLLLDEIEKAHPDLWDLLLGVLDKGELHLGDGSAADLRQSMIFLTSNVGAREQKGAIGFDPPGFGSRFAEIPQSAARRLFSPEFRNRLTAMLSYRALSDADLRAVAELELQRCAARLLQTRGLFLTFSPSAIDLVAGRRGENPQFGARPIGRAIERLLELPLAHLILSGQMKMGEELMVDADPQRGDVLRFQRHRGASM